MEIASLTTIIEGKIVYVAFPEDSSKWWLLLSALHWLRCVEKCSPLFHDLLCVWIIKLSILIASEWELSFLMLGQLHFWNTDGKMLLLDFLGTSSCICLFLWWACLYKLSFDLLVFVAWYFCPLNPNFYPATGHFTVVGLTMQHQSLQILRLSVFKRNIPLFIYLHNCVCCCAA